jgi:uncharacterized protein (UPF0332 family)
MKAKEIIIKSLKRAKGDRGLRIINPNNHLAEGHIKKADHNLIVMTDLNKLGHEDWVVISAYYAMYQSAMALLSKVGLGSKEHAATAAVLEYFFSGQLSAELIGKFNDTKERKDKIEAITINEKYIDYLWKAKRERETVQYGISINYKEVDNIIRNAREFVSKIKLVINGLNEEFVKIISGELKEFQ